MGYRLESFVPGNIYHIYNRGVNRAKIFLDDRDRLRFLANLVYYLKRGKYPGYVPAIKSNGALKKFQELKERKPKTGEGMVDLLCYCLMPNHFHLLLRGNINKGISIYMQRLLNSYVRYYNTKHERTGPLFDGPYKAVSVTADEQLLHVTRYIHLNPYVAQLVDNPFEYHWFSLAEYIPPARSSICHVDFLQGMIKPHEYRKFVIDYADYARELAAIKHLLLEKE